MFWCSFALHLPYISCDVPLYICTLKHSTLSPLSCGDKIFTCHSGIGQKGSNVFHVATLSFQSVQHISTGETVAMLNRSGALMGTPRSGPLETTCFRGLTIPPDNASSDDQYEWASRITFYDSENISKASG